jgi:PPM family protein phosphatase
VATPVIQYTAAAVSDRGRRRRSNEDAFGYSVKKGIYFVCDGMGGAAAGEVASAMAVDELMRLLGGFAAASPLEDAVRQAISAANQAIYARAQSNPRFDGMGTTLVGLATEGRRIFVFNVGDSRCYRLRDLHLEQISLDHSLVEEQVRMGRMTRAEAQCSPLRHVITRALGTQESVEPDLFALEAKPGDLFLLCSDGLTGKIDDSLMASMLAEDLPLDELCAKLVDAANKAGGPDNITCLLVRVES